ncbi:uncharacterized protein [Haliotis asinina]|uniref:uncharacterized protein n=1 Tax=Haliotis asinina TaxID=109174 RepID=UPI0035323ED2
MSGIGLIVMSCHVISIKGHSHASGCVVSSADPAILEEKSDLVYVIEYNLTFNGYPPEFWSQVAGRDWYTPYRFYKCSNPSTEKYLLMFHYYHGVFQSLVHAGQRFQEVNVTTEPADCLSRMTKEEIGALINLYIFNNLFPTSNSTPKTVSQVSVCTARITGDKDGHGAKRHAYRCCRVSSVDQVRCYMLAEDVWTGIFRLVITIASVILFLYCPLLIPQSLDVDVFTYVPRTSKFLNVMTTRNPDFKILTPRTLLVPFKKCQAMKTFSTVISKIPTDVLCTFQVKKVLFEADFDRFLAANEVPFGVFRTLFDSLIKFNIRHNDTLEDCCRGRICGQCSCRACPQWQILLRAIRAIVIFAILALPAVPRLYLLCIPRLHRPKEDKSTQHSDHEYMFDYDIHTSTGIAIVSVLTSFYILHVIIVIVDGTFDRNLYRLYRKLLCMNNERFSVTYRTKMLQSLVRNSLRPLQSFGILVLPLWLVCLFISPLTILLYFILTSPVFRIAHRVLKIIVGTCQRKRNEQEEIGVRAFEVAFTVTMFAVFAVLAIGCNFFLHAAAVVIIDMLINITVTIRIVPILMLLVFYVRDTFRQVSSTYLTYHDIILRLIMARKMEAVRDIMNNNPQNRENIGFEVCTSEDDQNYRGPTFLLKDGDLRMNTRSLVLLFHKNDTPFLSKKFFHQATGMNCPGVPGYISGSVVKAIFKLSRVFVFLFCLQVIVMAYGDVSYISPGGQFCATLITGLIPFALRKFLLPNGIDLNTLGVIDDSNLGFFTQFETLMNTFRQAWKLHDIVPVTDDRAVSKVISPTGSDVSKLTKASEIIDTEMKIADHMEIDLIVDLTGENTTDCGSA